MQKQQSHLRNPANVPVHLLLLGPFQMHVAGQKVTLSARKVKALLVYLAVRIDEDVPRDTLAGLLWGDSPPEQARASLRQSLSSVRKVLGVVADASIFSSNETVRLASDLIWTDRHSIEANLEDTSIDECFAAANQCRGEFMEGFGLNEPEFDYWLSAERALVRTQISSLLSRLIDHCEQGKRFEDALKYGTKLLALDPLQENIHRTLMRLLAAQGRYDAALNQFEQCRRVLVEQLDVAPEPATQDLMQLIKMQRGKRIPKEDQEDTTSLSDRAANRPSVAILPFANLSGDPEQEYFSDGITSDIITGLSRFHTLSVIARHSSFAFKGGKIGINEVGHKLGVQYIVEGSVRRAGNTVRITAQLIEAETGNHLWAERYDRELDDIFSVQDDVTKSIVAVLPGRVQDSVADRASRMSTVNMKAYEYMLQGKHLRDGLNAEDNARARVALEKALKLDPNYARAYMYLADTYVVDLWLGLAEEDASHKSLQLSRKGAGLDNSDVYIQDQLGFALLCEGLWEDAEIQFTQTLSRIVNEAESMAWCGYAFLLLGHHERALEIVVEAMRLDPLHSPALDWVWGQVHFFAGNYDDVVRALIGEALLNSLGHAFLVSAYSYLGKMDEAQNALKMFINTRRKEFSSRNLVIEGDTITCLAGSYKGMWRNSADWEHLVEGLRKAGLPD